MKNLEELNLEEHKVDMRCKSGNLEDLINRLGPEVRNEEVKELFESAQVEDVDIENKPGYRNLLRSKAGSSGT